MACRLIIFFFFWSSLFGVDPLPSWNEGAAKTAILSFVKAVTTENSPSYVPPEDRVATFDQDGTLWVEQPLYPQFTFAIDRIKAMSPSHPEWKEQEPFKSILAGTPHFTEQDIAKMLAATHAGMTIQEFQQEVDKWLESTQHPRYKRPYTDLVYKPMLEVIELFKKNHFQVYIVSGGGQEFIRTYSERIYGIPPQNVVGTANKVHYTYQEGKPVLIKLPEVLFINDRGGKPEGINLIIGRHPIAAFGNSIGDREMLEWTKSHGGHCLEVLIHHDDAEREYAYGPDSKIGTFPDSLLEEARSHDWQIVSMKNDWKLLFN